jgi:hypothetical protein
MAAEDEMRDVCDVHFGLGKQEVCANPLDWPGRLVVQIKRFEFVIPGMPAWKKQEEVSYPYHEMTFPGGDTHLVRSIVCHVGDGTDSGHYYALCRDTDKLDTKWTRYDDKDKWEVKDRVNDIVTPEAYLLFLKKPAKGDAGVPDAAVQASTGAADAADAAGAAGAAGAGASAATRRRRLSIEPTKLRMDMEMALLPRSPAAKMERHSNAPPVLDTNLPKRMRHLTVEPASPTGAPPPDERRPAHLRPDPNSAAPKQKSWRRANPGAGGRASVAGLFSPATAAAADQAPQTSIPTATTDTVPRDVWFSRSANAQAGSS